MNATAPYFTKLYWELEYCFEGTPVLVTHRPYNGESVEEMEAHLGEDGTARIVPGRAILDDPAALEAYMAG